MELLTTELGITWSFFFRLASELMCIILNGKHKNSTLPNSEHCEVAVQSSAFFSLLNFSGRKVLFFDLEAGEWTSMPDLVYRTGEPIWLSFLSKIMQHSDRTLALEAWRTLSAYGSRTNWIRTAISIRCSVVRCILKLRL